VSPLRRLATRCASALAGRSRLVLSASVLLALASGLAASRIRLDADLARLLPRSSPAAADYLSFLKTFGGFEKVYILVRQAPGRPADPALLIGAAEGLVDRFGHSRLVSSARSGMTSDDENFFFQTVAPRMPVLIEDVALPDLSRRLRHDEIVRRVAWMRQTLSSPAGSAAAQLMANDPLGLTDGLIGSTSALLPIDPFTGAFLSRDGKAALVILTPVQAELDPAGGRALQAELDRAYAAVRLESSAPLEFAALGGPLYAAQDESMLRSDLTRTATSTLAGVTLVLVLGFEGILLPVAILLAVVFGVVWTAGFVGVTLGSVTVIGVGFTAALLGMGVDYGIHGGVRFRELRWAGASPTEALAGVLHANGPGVLTAALATAVGLATLVVARFAPLREAGLVLAVGVLATLLATALVSAAVVTDSGLVRRPPPLSRGWTRWGAPAVRALALGSRRSPRIVLALTLALTIGAAWGLSRLDISTDLRALRPTDEPTARAERDLVSAFALGLDTFTVVAHGRTVGEALDRAAMVRAFLRGRLGPRAEITSPSDWLAEGARTKRRLSALRTIGLDHAADDFERELTAAGFQLAPFAKALAAMRALGKGQEVADPSPASWPGWMSELLRHTPDGGTAVAVHARLTVPGAEHELGAIASDLQRRDPTLAFASVTRVGGELRELALGDLSHASSLALALIAGVVLVSFRGRLGPSLLSFVPLALGTCWTFGAWGAAGERIDLLGIFTVPLLLSTGIILGAHAVHWRRLHPEGGFVGTFEDMGLAMVLATLTTALGFGSLATSRVPGLQHAGILVAGGICSCLLAAFVVLPALEAVLPERQKAALEPQAEKAP
jgi:predicted RND superfamily exporter protein